ncbi:MAG TPA: UDP-N-acetylmuramate dehydrogenase [Candidatus Paceibacterota bacterium]|nr:UDP-N-acetylmuramate dehydrogenase [Candidatus Paceibacterota bacterium]
MKISENIPLAPYTTFKIGGAARYFCVAKSEAEIGEAVAFARNKKVLLVILGGGSNVVVSDAGVPGLVMKMEMKGATYEEKDGAIMVTAWAGENWDELVGKTVEWGAWGLENLSAIPGTVGAAPVQNIGAYGTEAMDVIESVRAIDRATGAARLFTNKECGFSYRDSIFKTEEGKKWAIVSVTFRLSRAPKPNLSYKDLKERFASRIAANETPSQSEIRDAVAEIRRGKFPDIAKTGTAGSFWKNPIICREHFEGIKKRFPDLPSFPADAPAGSREVGPAEEAVKVPLAWILDKICGLKGYSKGKISLHQNQPLVVVAEKGATAAEVCSFENGIRAIVKEKTGIDIQPEVGFLE